MVLFRTALSKRKKKILKWINNTSSLISQPVNVSPSRRNMHCQDSFSTASCSRSPITAHMIFAGVFAPSVQQYDNFVADLRDMSASSQGRREGCPRPRTAKQNLNEPVPYRTHAAVRGPGAADSSPSRPRRTTRRPTRRPSGPPRTTPAHAAVLHAAKAAKSCQFYYETFG